MYKITEKTKEKLKTNIPPPVIPTASEASSFIKLVNWSFSYLKYL